MELGYRRPPAAQGAGFCTRLVWKENTSSGVSKLTCFTCIKETDLPLENRCQTQHSNGYSPTGVCETGPE